ncbi:MAG: cupin domain-containing protein [Sneathiella sp.]
MEKTGASQSNPPVSDRNTQSSETVEIPPSIGAQIRDLRKAQGLSIAVLAEKVGRSSGYISQIERELSGVSIASLQRIATALGVQINWFFQGQGIAPEAERDIIVRKHNRRILKFEKMGVTEELLSPTLTGEFEMIRTVFAPGASTGKRERMRKGQEAGTVLSGSLELWIDDELFTLEAGDSFSLRQPGLHRCVNSGDVDTVIIWVISPPSY